MSPPMLPLSSSFCPLSTSNAVELRNVRLQLQVRPSLSRFPGNRGRQTTRQPQDRAPAVPLSFRDLQAVSTFQSYFSGHWWNQARAWNPCCLITLLQLPLCLSRCFQFLAGAPAGLMKWY